MSLVANGIENIPKQRIKSLIKSPVKSAEAVNLVYVNDNEPGIERAKNGSSFEYFFKGKKITDEEELLRIKRLVIPPVWKNVWICPLENGHLQVTGTDIRHRKQYKYHPDWNALRNHTKFYRLYQFGSALTDMRLKLEKDISLPGLPLEKVLATVVSLMERTNIRVGNTSYEKIYGSYGITTMKDKHVKVAGSTIKFCFKGKKGVHHDVNIKNRKLASIVRQCQEIPGKELFQYNEDGVWKDVDSGTVNAYIRKISGGDFTAKDFRTWNGTLHSLLFFKDLGFSETQTETKKNIVSALDFVSKLLGNTRSVCRKYYVHPVIISLYETKTLEKYISQLDKLEEDDNKSGLTKEEKLLMTILKSN